MRRHLYLLPGEWDALSWDTKMLYISGLEAEGFLEPLPEPDAIPGGFGALAGDLSTLSGYSVRVVQLPT